MSIVIQGGIVITANASDEVLSDTSLVIRGTEISDIVSGNKNNAVHSSEVINAHGYVIIPGFVQTHVHLCQTLFRGMADDLELLDWLQKKIFPYEAAHNEHSMYCSAILGIAELLRSGTTTILDMGSVNHQEEIIRAIGESGMRAFVGKAMMDINDAYPALRESTDKSLTSTRDLAERWHNSYEGRVRYAVAPRFVLSCSDTLLHSTREMLNSLDGVLFHTHASENTGEVDAVRKRCHMENIEYLNHLGLLSTKACLAHCIHLTNNEIDILAQTRTNVTHCPSSNLKLGSGIAKIPLLMDRNINVALGADGAPCNNSLNMFQEMRLASLLQKPLHGPTAMPAKRVFSMATMGGAKALGMEREIGSIEVGKKADLVLLDLRNVWNPIEQENLFSSIVFSASPENVDSVMINGKWVYRKKEFVSIDVERIMHTSSLELKQLHNRVVFV